MDLIFWAIFWALFFSWQVAPAILVWRAHAMGWLSIQGTLAAATITTLGTGAAWYVGFTNSSSTSPVVLMFSPLYLLVAALLICGADLAARTAARVWRHR